MSMHQGANILPMMFEDWIQSGEVWMMSSLHSRLTQSSSQKRRGRHVMLPYWEVKKRFGNVFGAQIMSEKKTQEKNKSANDSTTYYMPHPEARDNEEPCTSQNTYLGLLSCAPQVSVPPGFRDKEL